MINFGDEKKGVINIIDKEENIINFYKEDITSGFYADVFKEFMSDDYIYNGCMVYYFNSIYWQEDKNEIYLNNYLDKEFFNFFIKQIKSFENKAEEIIYLIDDKKIQKEDLKELSSLIFTLKKSVLSLRNFNSRIPIIKDIKNKIYKDNIEFDNKPNLIAFNNKIFDLYKNEFVKPDKEDYISITTGYDFIDMNKKTIQKKTKVLNDLIDTIFTDKTIKKFYLTLLSTSLYGQNLGKFILANGSGGNGKGCLNELAYRTLGNYAYILPSSIFLDKIKGGASPELAGLHNKRLVISREPDNEYIFKASTIKELTGGEELPVRTIYSTNMKTKLKMTLIMELNEKLKIDETTDAIGRRVLDVPFNAKFVDKSIYDKMNDTQKIGVGIADIYYVSNEFKEDYKQILFMTLTSYFKEYYDNKLSLTIPQIILDRNDEYLKNSDDLYTWLSETYKITNNKKDVITVKTIYNKFKLSDIYINLNKMKKRALTYTKFNNLISNNPYLKNYYGINKDKTYEISNIELKPDDDNNTNKMEEEEEEEPKIITSSKIEIKTTKTINKKIDFDVDVMDEDEEDKRKEFLKRINK
jgi:phage/plasmid-associated DNA primase